MRSLRSPFRQQRCTIPVLPVGGSCFEGFDFLFGRSVKNEGPVVAEVGVLGEPLSSLEI